MTLPAVATNEYSRVRERWKQEAMESLDEQANRMRSTGATVVGTYLKQGRPAEEVVVGDDGSEEAFTNSMVGFPTFSVA